LDLFSNLLPLIICNGLILFVGVRLVSFVLLLLLLVSFVLLLLSLLVSFVVSLLLSLLVSFGLLLLSLLVSFVLLLLSLLLLTSSLLRVSLDFFSSDLFDFFLITKYTIVAIITIIISNKLIPT